MNTEDFIVKLETIFAKLNLSPSTFADQIGVQRSSISHLLSGRNKPSLDFVLKVFDTFLQIDLYWLLGQKELKQQLKISSTELSSSPVEKVHVPIKEEKKLTKQLEEKVSETIKTKIIQSSEVEKIVVFYTNGTFAEYSPREK